MATGTEANQFFEQASKVVASAMREVMKDGTIAAAGRMGIDELGAATQAFPDSIQQQESGSIWNPTQGEIAQARADHSPANFGQSTEPRLPSPSEIAVETKSYQPQPQHTQTLDQDHGQSY